MPVEPDNWNVVELLKWTTAWFEKKSIRAARRQAEELLCHVLDLDRLNLYLQFEYLPTPAERRRFKELIQRRIMGEPLQHLTGVQQFFGLKLKVDRRALVPRVETEQLAEKLVERLKKTQNPRVIDICTGGGCLALALASKLDLRLWACDIDPAALALARENLERFKLGDKVSLHEGDLFNPLEKDGPGRGSVDLLVSNPPYIGTDEKGSLDEEVRAWEPEIALFGGMDGGNILRRLFDGAGAWLKPGGFAVFEIGPRHAGELLEKARVSSDWKRAWVEQDDQGIDRFFWAEKNANRS